MDWEENGCACGSQRSNQLFEVQDINFGSTTASGQIMLCSDCESIFPMTRPTSGSISTAYSRYYTKDARKSGLVRSVFRWFFQKARANYSQRCTPPEAKAVLDYGCGSGDYLVNLSSSKTNAKLYGTDISPVRDAEDKGFEFIALDELEKCGHFYDHITLSHVIEHLHSPEAVLSELGQRLASGGTIWMSTPNAKSFLIRSFCQFSRDIDFPRHIHIFSERCLGTIAERNGFVVERLSPPLVNSILNFFSCLKNLWRDSDTSAYGKILISVQATLRLSIHIFTRPSKRRAVAGEITFLLRKAH